MYILILLEKQYYDCMVCMHAHLVHAYIMLSCTGIYDDPAEEPVQKTTSNSRGNTAEV